MNVIKIETPKGTWTAIPTAELKNELLRARLSISEGEDPRSALEALTDKVKALEELNN